MPVTKNILRNGEADDQSSEGQGWFHFWLRYHSASSLYAMGQGFIDISEITIGLLLQLGSKKSWPSKVLVGGGAGARAGKRLLPGTSV